MRKPMSNEGDFTGDAAQLRRRAEEWAQGKSAPAPEDLEALPREKAERTLHELHVHQIELEMQNEELRRAQAELDAERARYFDLYDLAPVGYCTISEQGLIVQANSTAAGLLGVARGALLRKRFANFVFPEDRDVDYLCRKQLLKLGTPQLCELRLVKTGGAALWVRLEAHITEDAGGAPMCRVAISDISVRKQAEKALRERLDRYRGLFDSATDAIFIHDAQARMLAVNQAACQSLGYTEAELMSMPIAQMYAPEQAHHVSDQMARLMRHSQVKSETVQRRKDGSLVPVEMTLRRIDWDDQPAMMVNCRNITERRRAERELRETQAILKAALDNSQVGIAIADAPSGTLRYVNDAALRIRGADRQSIVDGVGIDQYMAAWQLADVDGRPLNPEEAPLARAIMFGEAHNREFVIRRTTGDDRMVLGSASPIRDPNGQIVAGMVVFMDVTEGRRAQEALRVSVGDLELAVQEKTVLLQEVHHRVKNNLAVIASLLSMQADASGNPEVTLALEGSRQRVHSMALIHEHLCGGYRVDRINFPEYAQQLVRDLTAATLGESSRISIAMDLEPIELGMDQAIPCAMILTELLSNALKHAFPDGRNGKVLISFREAEFGVWELAIEDNGVGLPGGGLGGPDARSLGLRIVAILARQLRGSLERGASSGTRIALRFPHPGEGQAAGAAAAALAACEN